MADTSPASLAKELLAILDRDKERIERIDNYIHGKHDDPYMPPHADDEYRLLAKRAVSNWMPLLIGTPAQALYVDGFRPGSTDSELRDHAVLEESGLVALAALAHGCPAGCGLPRRSRVRPLLRADGEGQEGRHLEGLVGQEDGGPVRGPGER